MPAHSPPSSRPPTPSTPSSPPSARLRRPSRSLMPRCTPALAASLLLLLLCAPSLFLSPASAQQLALVTEDDTLKSTFAFCAVTPPAIPDNEGWSGEARSKVGLQDCFRNADRPGFQVPDTVWNAVHVAGGCVFNSTGFATCDSTYSVTSYPWPALKAETRQAATSVCWLFPNGTLGCSNTLTKGANILPLLPYSPLVFGWQPEPLQFVDEPLVDPPVTILEWVLAADQMADEFVCTLLSNQSIRCGVTDWAYRALVDLAPPDPLFVDNSTTVLQMCAGTAHVCVLYVSGELYCWGTAESCLGGACVAPSSTLFSSVACGATFTCGIRLDGGISCWGSPLTTSALRPPSGVYGQLVVSEQIPCAIEAGDASPVCWGAVSRSYTGQTLVLPPMSVKAPSNLCALRKRHNALLTPSIACWSSDGSAGGVMFLPRALMHTSFHSMAVTRFYLCVQLLADATVHCWGDRNDPSASLFLAVPPPQVLGPVREIGIAPGSDQMWVWMPDGSLRAYGDTPNPILPALANSSALQWKFFHVAGTHGQAVGGVLTNGSAILVAPRTNGCDFLLTPQEVLEQMRLRTHNESLEYVDLFVSTQVATCPNVCAVFSNGVPACFGMTFSSLVSNDSQIWFPTLPASAGGGALQITMQITLNVLESAPEFSVCILGFSGLASCWLIQVGGGVTLATNAPDQRLSRIFADADTLMYGMSVLEEQLVSWNPSQVAFLGRVHTIPALAMQVAPQFHYRRRGEPVKPCPPGTFSLGVGAITPVCSGLCAPGRYGNSSRNVDALCGGICPRGYFCPAGTSKPIPCPAGSFGAVEGLVNSGCSGSCLPGFYCPPASSAKDHSPCPEGWASKYPDLPCAACPINTFSGPSPSSQCTPCPPASFAPTPGMASCVACPTSGIECGLGSAIILPGHWAHMDMGSMGGGGNASSGSGASSSFDPSAFGPFVCPPDLCDGDGDSADAPTVGGALVNPCSAHRSLSADNPLCGRCDEGYWEWNATCTDCPAVNWPILLLLVVLAFLAVIVLHALSQRSTSSARLSILIFFAQTALLLLRARSSDELSRVFAWLHLFNLSITTPTGHECVGRFTAQQSLLLEAFLPLATLIPMFILAAIRGLWLRCVYERRHPPGRGRASIDGARAKFPWHEYVRTSITILLIAYQQLCVCTLAYLQCVPVGPYRVVFSRPSIDCTSRDYAALQPLAILTIIFLAGVVPMALAIFLYRHRGIILHQQQALRAAQIEQGAEEPLPPSLLLLAAASASSGGGGAKRAGGGGGGGGGSGYVSDRSVSVSSFPEHSIMLTDATLASGSDESSLFPLTKSIVAGMPHGQGQGRDRHRRGRSSAGSNAAASGASGSSVASGSSGLLGAPSTTAANILFTKRFSALYISYRPGCYLWLVFLLLRRVTLIMCAVLLLTSPQYQSLVFSLLCLLIAAIHSHVQPFFVAIDNRLETMSLVSLLALSQVLASQASSSDRPMPLLVQILAGLLLTVPMLVLVAVIIQFATQRPRVRALLRVCARQLPFLCGWCMPAPAKQRRSAPREQHQQQHQKRSSNAGEDDDAAAEEPDGDADPPSQQHPRVESAPADHSVLLHSSFAGSFERHVGSLLGSSSTAASASDNVSVASSAAAASPAANNLQRVGSSLHRPVHRAPPLARPEEEVFTPLDSMHPPADHRLPPASSADAADRNQQWKQALL